MSEPGISKKQNYASEVGVSAGAIVIGVVAAIDAQGRPLVDFQENPSSEPIQALTTISLSKSHVLRQVALLFSNGNLAEPVIMGLIHNPLDELLENFDLIPADNADNSPFPESQEKVGKPLEIKRNNENTVYVDGERISIEGAEEVTFKCGKASITLTKSGKILIRGTYLLNRSSGVNRILGGSVQVN